MNRKPVLFRTWNDFINFKGLHSERTQILKDSMLQLGSPGTLRQLVWVALIDPDYAGECLKFFRQVPHHMLITLQAEQTIQKILSRPFPQILKDLENKDSVGKILRLFAYKRKDIGVIFGMQYIAAIFSAMFVVETDAFIMFCYVYENLYPPDFFLKKNRRIGLHQELRIFALMAETMRPKLLNCLKAVHKGERSKESDSSPFITLMKNVADVWFRTIFSTLLPFKMLLRTIDVFLVFGIEFLQKFGLAYLSKKEKFIINSIKTETKGLQLGASADALIIAGNLTKSKLLNKAENFDVEPLIKKCLKKDSYLHLKRFNFLSKAIILESKSSERILRLKKCKNLLHENPLNAFTATAIIKALSSEKVTRTEFCKVTNEIANWAHLASNSIFTLFDQNGDEEIEKSLISIGVSLLVSDSIDAKLLLCFEVFDTDESGFLSTTELAEMVIQIENALDGRSSFYQKEAESMMKVLDSNGDSKISIEEFIKTVKANKIFQPIIEYIQMASADHIEKVLEDQYEDIHSPLSVSINYSDNESASDNLIEKNILEAEIQYTEFENPDENILEDDPEKVKHDLEEEKEETVEEILENQKDFMENSDKYISEEKMYESFKASTDIEQEVNTRNTKNNLNRSESTGGKIETLKNEHSVNLEHFVDFPEAQNDTKDRDCVRLCSKESCYIF